MENNYMENKLREEIREILKPAWESTITYEGTGHKLVEELETLINKENKVTGETSDGYHTFNELYVFRKLYNACLFNEWARQGLFDVHKSWKHSDGEYCFGGGWFVVMADLPTGQISNHYGAGDWDLFKCEERKVASKWDGHTPQDVTERLNNYLKTNTDKESK